MTHDPVHAIYLGAGALYFAGGMYFSLKNFQITDHDGFWFLIALFAGSMAGAMIAGVLWSANILSEASIHPYYDNFFLIASVFLFTASYTLSKKEHRVRIF